MSFPPSFLELYLNVFFFFTGDSSKITFDPDAVNLGDHNSSKLTQVSSEVVSKECTSFLDRLHEAVRESGILAHVNSIRDLGHIRKSVHEYMRTDKAAFDSRCVHQPNLIQFAFVKRLVLICL